MSVHSVELNRFPTVKRFIEENIDIIRNNKFELLYERAISSQGCESSGVLTDVLLTAGINPMDYFELVPPLYLDGSTLSSIVVPDHVSAIRKSGFAWSKLTSVILHDNCEINSLSFYKCTELKSIKIPALMNEIPESCFSGCKSLVSVDLADIEQIAAEAFSDCTLLQDIVIPDNINWISDSAFINCPYVKFVVNATNTCAIDFANEHAIPVKLI